jgi:hypothetical protein
MFAAAACQAQTESQILQRERWNNESLSQLYEEEPETARIHPHFGNSYFRKEKAMGAR